MAKRKKKQSKAHLEDLFLEMNRVHLDYDSRLQLILKEVIHLFNKQNGIEDYDIEETMEGYFKWMYGNGTRLQ